MALVDASEISSMITSQFKIIKPITVIHQYLLHLFT